MDIKRMKTGCCKAFQDGGMCDGIHKLAGECGLNIISFGSAEYI